MAFRRSLAVLLLVAMPAAAQTATASAANPAASPAPMPDPLVSPDLQSSTHTPSLLALVQQSAWQDPVIAAARQQFKELPGACSAAVFKPTGRLVIYAAPRFAPDGKLQSGIWSERVDVTGCGAPRQQNVLTVAQPDNPPVRIPTMPGDSLADPQTQKNALQYAQAIAVRASPPKCTRQTFTDAKFMGYTGLPDPEVKDRNSRAWREDWSLSACGATYIIEITFKPNAQGIQLSATNPVKQP